jgi:hypothetical protein
MIHVFETMLLLKIYPIVLFMTQLLLASVLSQNFVAILLHATDTARIAQNLPLRPIYTIVLIANSLLTSAALIILVSFMLFIVRVGGTINSEYFNPAMFIIVFTFSALSLSTTVLSITGLIVFIRFSRKSGSTTDTFSSKLRNCCVIQYLKPVMIILALNFVYFIGMACWAIYYFSSKDDPRNFTRTIGDFFLVWTFWGVWSQMSFLTLLFLTLFDLKAFIRAYRCQSCKKRSDSFIGRPDDLTESLLINKDN